MKPKPICPVHKGSDYLSLFWEFTYNENNYSLYKCDACDLVFYFPFPTINYEHHTDSIDSLKDYVHLNSNIEGLINNLLDHIPEGKVSSMMEVGCGFGFTLDFAKRILGLEVVGYEPSLYGEKGAEELDLNIKRSYLTPDNVKDQQYDLIYLSEVLEHIEDPVAFLGLLKEGLTDDGFLILTTPDYKELNIDLTHPTELALLSPGAHTLLFSKESLEKVLRSIGFNYISITTINCSLVAVCSVQQKSWKRVENKNDLIRSYYVDVLKRVKPNSLAYIGILYRLFRNYIDFGNYKEAIDLYKEYPFPNMPTVYEINKSADIGSFNQLGSVCSSVLSYYIGVLKLNYLSDFVSAAYYFHISYLLCKKKVALMPNSSVLEYGILWLAQYHYALSLFNAGELDKALDSTKEITGFSQGIGDSSLPVPSGDLLDLTFALEKKISQEILLRV